MNWSSTLVEVLSDLNAFELKFITLIFLGIMLIHFVFPFWVPKKYYSNNKNNPNLIHYSRWKLAGWIISTIINIFIFIALIIFHYAIFTEFLYHLDSSVIFLSIISFILLILLLVITALIGFWNIAQCLFLRYELISDGIKYYSVFGKKGIILWSEVINVSVLKKYLQLKHRYFLLKTKDQKQLKVPIIIIGIFGFSDAVIQNVKSEYIESEAFRIIKKIQNDTIPRFVFNKI